MKNRYIVILSALAIIIGSCTPIRKAEQMYQRFDYAKAIPVYEKIATSGNKHSTLAISRLGDINRLSSNFDKSAEWYAKAVTEENVIPEAYLNYGQVLRSLGKYSEAIEQFEKYMQIKPEDPRGRIYADYCRMFFERTEQSDIYEIANAEGLNSPYSDFSPVVYGDKVIFASDRGDQTGAKTYGWTGAYYLDMFEADIPTLDNPEKDLNANIFARELNMIYHDGPASFSPDNNTIYYTRAFRKMGSVDTSRYYTNRLQMYSSTLENNKWTEPVPFYLNSELYSVGHPTISSDGKTMYFVSDMPGGVGGTDLWKVEMVDGAWTNLTNIKELNTFGNEMFPFYDKSGALYFSSDGWPGLGSLDVFKTSFTNNKWSEPEHLKEPVNSPADDFGFYKAESGLVLFSSNRPGGKGDDDIYMAKAAKFYEEILVSGLVKDRQDGQILPNSTVLVWNTDMQEVTVLKTDNQGQYSILLKGGHSYIFKAVKSNYSTDCLSLAIPPRSLDSTMSNRDLLLMKLEIDEIFKLENVYYDFDKWNIRSDASIELNKVVDFLNINPNVTVELGSHTDSRGSHPYNEKLADRRAESAVMYITGKGISKDRITFKGYGETQLVNNCADGVDCTEAQHQDNRRTEIKITGIDETAQKSNYEPLENYSNGQVIKLSELENDFFLNCMDKKEI